jgi:hypothetical protein
MKWKRFHSGIPYQDRRISYLGEYCGIDKIRTFGLHSFLRSLNKSNLDPGSGRPVLSRFLLFKLLKKE